MHSKKQNRTQLKRKDFEQYLRSTDQRYKNSIEKKALDDAFEQDALDGWSESNVPFSRIQALTSKHSFNYIRYSLFSLSLLLLVGISYAYFANKKVQKEKIKKSISETYLTNNKIVKNKDIIIQNKKDTIPSVFEHNFGIKQIQHTFQTQKNNSSERENNEIDLLKMKEIELIDFNHTTSIQQKFGDEVYLNQLKLVDYRTYRSKKSSTITIITATNGTDASKEKSNSVSQDEIDQKRNIPYIEFIAQTTKLLANEQYKLAFSQFQIILSQFTTDINATFYSGLCLYNSNEYTKAIPFFEKCLLNEFSNFNEEAQWYLAKSYQANGQPEKANALFETIKEQGGYYAKFVK